MKNIIDLLKELPYLCTLKGSTNQEIFIVGKKFWVISKDGICKCDRLNVIIVTKEGITNNPFIIKDLYIIK